MQKHDSIAVLDFGGQYAHLIANRIRRLNLFCEILPCEVSAEKLKKFQGIILSGGPSSVYQKNAPLCSSAIFSLNIPILGICYGHQLICRLLGGVVKKGTIYEYGPAILQTKSPPHSLTKPADNSSVWMSHGDEITQLPPNFESIAFTENCPNAAFTSLSKKIYGIQFHPEVSHSEKGQQVLDSFLNICKVKHTWNMKNYQEQLRKTITKKCHNKKVFLLVSGGVDSTVCFTLLNRILGSNRVMGLHIDNGFMRKNESQEIIDFMKKEGFSNLKHINASSDFLSAIKKEDQPEIKRKIIGSLFLTVLDSTMKDLGLDSNEWIIAQGTTYPDTIESGGTDKSVTIKTHHNRVPEALKRLKNGTIIEPIADLYKDEVRQLGLEYGIPPHLIWRHPFPGPGLAVRLLCQNVHTINSSESFLDQETNKNIQNTLHKFNYTGQIMPIKSVGVQGDSRTYAHPLLLEQLQSWEKAEKFALNVINQFSIINRVVWEVGCIFKNTLPKYLLVEQYCTKENLSFLQKVDAICSKMLKKNDLYTKIWQMPVVLLPLKIQGKPTIVIRPISSSEAMTANFFQIEETILEDLWLQLKKIGVGSLWYDLTHKPPGTIEWE